MDNPTTFCVFFLCVIVLSSAEDVSECSDKSEDFYSVCHAADSGPCPSDNSTLEICCHCFDICCHDEDHDNDSVNVTVIVPLIRLHAAQIEPGSNRSLISVLNSGLGEVTRSLGGAVSGTLEAVGDRVRLRRSGASKTSRGTGEDVAEEVEGTGKNSSLFSSKKELEEAIATAVRIALNRLANTLKNVTESEEPVPDTNATSTTIAPVVEGCASKTKRCEEQEPDLLDEFFPPRNGGRGKGKGRKRRENSVLHEYNFRTLEIKKGKDFGSSGGVIAKGEILIPITKNVSRNATEHDVMMSTTEETADVTSTDPSISTETSTDMSHANVTRKRGQPAQGSRRGLPNRQNKTNYQVSSPRPSLVTSSLLVPKIKPGKCDNLTATANKTCIAIQPDAAQCLLDTECEGTWKCCFYGCKPYNKIGICSVPVFY